MQETWSLTTLWALFRRGLKWILLGALVGLVTAVLVTHYGMTKKYTSSLILCCQTSRGTESVSDYNLSRSLAATYSYLLSDDAILQRVADTLGGNLTTGALRSMISVSSLGETDLIRVEATATDSRLAAELCTVLAELAPEVLVDYGYASQVRPFGTAKVPTSPSSPRMSTNVLLGTLLGAGVIFVIIVLRHMFDNSITDAETLRSQLALPVLGEVPPLEHPAARRIWGSSSHG